MRYRQVSDETMLKALITVLSDPDILNPEPKPKKVTRYRRWVQFLRTKPSGPFWHEHPER